MRLGRVDQHISIEVKDNGIGIPADQLDKVFERFHQIKKEDEYAYEGTGIGLALVSELVKVHEGKISIDSEEGKGTIFTITLPFIAALEQGSNAIKIISNPDQIFETEVNLWPHSKQLPGKDQSTNPVLLIIEDNEDLRYHLHQKFEKDYQVLLAKAGDEGLQLAFDQIPDLIISDVMMPRKNGYEVCRHLKLDQRTNHIPVILLSAKAAQEEKIEGLLTGADAYLTKPYSQEELALVVQNLLERSHRLRELLTNTTAPETKELIESPQHQFITQLHDQIEQNLSDPNFGVEELAKAVFLSRSQLFRKLKTIAGQTPVLFIRSYRLSRARQLLEAGEGNGAEIAYQVGFSGQNYFYKCFKEEFGVSAKEVMKGKS